MTKTLAELIDRAYYIKKHFNLGSYELSVYEDGSFADFRVNKILDLPTLMRLAGGLQLKLYPGDDKIIVRLFEREDDGE